MTQQEIIATIQVATTRITASNKPPQAVAAAFKAAAERK